MLEHLASGLAALYLMFFTGVVTAASPCMAAMAPAVAGYTGFRGRNWGYGVASGGCLVAGFAGVLALLGMSAVFTEKWLAPLREGLPYLLGTVYLVLGWYMVARSRLVSVNLPVKFAGFYCRSSRGKFRWGRGTLPGAFLLGMGLGIVPSPCVTPVAMSVFAYTSASGEITKGAAMLFAFGLGHGVLLFLLSAFSGFLQRMVQWRSWLRLLNPLMGIALLVLGFYLLTWGRHLFQHSM